MVRDCDVETLLRDGIPLNEHFIALKNKFNCEKEEMERKARNLQDEIQNETMKNRQRQHKIEILGHEFNDIQGNHDKYKDTTQSTIDE
jgi:hypothetical protein